MQNVAKGQERAGLAGVFTSQGPEGVVIVLSGSSKKTLLSHFSLYLGIESTILKGYLKIDGLGTRRSL